MYGLIGKIVAAPNKRDDLIKILLESIDGMPGCISYIVAKDAADESAIWITEVWDTQANHDASLAIPAVRDAITKAKPMIAGGSRAATTNPIAGIGLPK